jgi:hypothetical protein
MFVFLLLGGLRARKPNMIHLVPLLLIPTLFLGWSIFSFFGKYGVDSILIFLWLVCFGMGFTIGFSHMKKLQLRFDKQNKKVEMPGSWIPLILSMSIFTAKFSLGMMGTMLPHLSGSVLFLCLEFFATIILGVFSGRGIGCLFRYKTTSDQS